MSERDKLDESLAAEYALGTLRGGARLRFQRRMLNEAQLAERVSRWELLLAGMDHHLVPVKPPDVIWKRISLALPARNKVTPQRRLLPWLAAAGITIAVLVSAYLYREPALTPLTVLDNAQHTGQWVVSTNSHQDRISLFPLGQVNVDPDRSLQLWLIPAGKAPVSLGLVNSEATSDFALNGLNTLNNASIAISLEPKGGSPTGLPTGPILFSSKL